MMMHSFYRGMIQISLCLSQRHTGTATPLLQSSNDIGNK